MQRNWPSTGVVKIARRKVSARSCCSQGVVSNKYGDLSAFYRSAKEDLDPLKNLRESLNFQVSEMAGVLDDVVHYSYNIVQYSPGD